MGNGRRTIQTAAVVTAVATAMTVAAAPVAADPPVFADHGHILVLDVETLSGSFPPVPVSARGCIDLADNRAVPETAHHDARHANLSGGDFTGRTGHVVIPTWPYSVSGQPVRECDDFMAMFGLD
jgi:hypothetical protein